MDNKFYVSYEAARLLKEKGYNNYSIVYDCSVEGDILLNQRPIYGEWAGDKDVYPCPTKAEAIDWLESKGIVVVLCRVTPIYMGYAGEKDWSFDLELKESGKYDGCLRFLTRLEAEEAAIIKALELL